jgi:hypothetical protein
MRLPPTLKDEEAEDDELTDYDDCPDISTDELLHELNKVPKDEGLSDNPQFLIIDMIPLHDRFYQHQIPPLSSASIL